MSQSLAIAFYKERTNYETAVQVSAVLYTTCKHCTQALQVLACYRYCLAARKADLVKYGRKLLKDDVSFWRDAEVISEVLGLAEDTEHRGDILLDIEEKFSDTQV